MKQSVPRARRLLAISLLTGPVVTLSSCLTPPPLIATNSSAPVNNESPKAKRVNLNTASAPELQGLPGVGPVLAERIVSHRERFGPFHRVEHLMMVPGFSDHKFRALRDLVTVE